MPDALFHFLDTWRRDLDPLKATNGLIVTLDQMIEYVAVNQPH